MNNYYLAERDRWFLNEGRIDPYTLSRFKIGDAVIVCADCKTVHRHDSWKASGKCTECGSDIKIAFNRNNLNRSGTVKAKTSSPQHLEPNYNSAKSKSQFTYSAEEYSYSSRQNNHDTYSTTPISTHRNKHPILRILITIVGIIGGGLLGNIVGIILQILLIIISVFGIFFDAYQISDSYDFTIRLTCMIICAIGGAIFLNTKIK